MFSVSQSCFDGLFDRINLVPKIQIKCIDTKNQLADMLTKGSFTRDEWNHLLCSFNIGNFSSTTCSEVMSKRTQEDSGEESQQNWSRWWIWSRDAAWRIRTCLPRLHRKVRENQFWKSNTSELVEWAATKNGETCDGRWLIRLLSMDLLKSGNLLKCWEHYIANISEKLTVGQSDEFYRVPPINWEDSSRKKWSLVNDEEVISLSHTKVHVFSVSVLCLRKVNQNPTSNSAWEEKLNWFKSSSQYRTLDTIDGEPMWNIFQDSPHCSSSKKSKNSCQNWAYNQKISLDGSSWRSKDNEPECDLSAKSRFYLCE